MPSASFLFSAVFRFRKATQEIFSELHGTKTHRHIFPVTYMETEGETEGGRGAPRPPGVVGPTLSARGGGVGPQDSPVVSTLPIYTSSMENPKYLIIIPRKVPSPPSSSTLDREGFGALPDTLPEGRTTHASHRSQAW